MNDTAVPLKERSSQVNSKVLCHPFGYLDFGLGYIWAVHGTIFRAGTRTQEHRSREMKRLSYSKNTTSIQLSPDKERPASLQSPRDPQNICHPSSLSSEGCASQPIRNANPQCGAGLTDPVGGSKSSSNLY